MAEILKKKNNPYATFVESTKLHTDFMAIVTNMHVHFRKGGVRAMSVQYIERHLLGYKKLQSTEAVTEH